MSRFISCLRNGVVIGTRSEAMVRPAISTSIVSHNTNNSDSRVFTIQACQNLSSLNMTIHRSLYTENALGISKLDRLRQKKEQMFMGSGAKERYIERLNGYVQSGDIQSIFKDDLVNLIGIASDEKDLDLLETIVSKTDEQQAEFFKGWGATVMRIYYKMNQLDRAMKNIKDLGRFREFFNLRSCYKVLMCMLYDAQRYQDVLDVFEFSQQHLKNESTEAGLDEFNSSDRDLSLVAFAAMAKLNNVENLQKAEALFNKIRQSTRNVGLRPTSFVAYLAVHNNQPKLALNLISNVPNRTYITLRELKIVSLIHLERFEDILLQLREYVSSIKRESNLLLESTFNTIKDNKDRIEDPAMRQELEDLLSEIKEGGHVSSATLEEVLFKQIDKERLDLKTDSRVGGGNQFRQGGGGYQGGNYNDNYNNNRYPSRGPRDQYGNNRYRDNQYGNSQYGNSQYGNNQYGNNQYGSNQYGTNQYSSRDRFQKRDNFDQDDEESEFSSNSDSRGRGGRQQKRFSYQNMNFD